MSTLAVFGLTLFILVLFLGIFISIHGFPGMALIALDVLAYALISGFERISLPAVSAVILFALLMEIADAFFAMKSSPRFSPNRQSLLCSLLGALLLGIALAPLLPFFGLVGGFFLGGMIGLCYALVRQELKLKLSYRIPLRMFIGRFSTLFLKGSVATATVCLTLLSTYN